MTHIMLTLFCAMGITCSQAQNVSNFYEKNKVLNYNDGEKAAGEIEQPTKFDPNFHIYLCFGQSNMEGNARIQPQDRKGISTRFRMMAAVNMDNTGRKKGQWYAAVPPLCRAWTGLTPADYFGRRMVEVLPDSITIGVINVAVGGASIDLFDEDKTAGVIEKSADWFKNFCKDYNNNPYRELIELAKKAQKVGVIKGILLHQGCTDNGQKDWPVRVNTIYTRMLNELGLKAADVPLLVGELMTEKDGGCCFHHNAVIANIKQTIPTAYVVPSAGCPGAPDKLHFTAEGYRILGRRYADVMLNILGKQRRNPIAQTYFSTDPAPVVSGDRLYVFTGHDEEKADFFWMNDWRLMSTADMVNWTDHGSPVAQCDFKWADDRAWAPQCIERNGKFYIYVPVHSRLSGGMAIGVGVADKITGPYKDALGKPLYEDGKWDHIDPTVMIDKDGQAYIYWGNPRLYYAKLNEDMISFASEVKCDSTLKRYTEGPWIFRQRELTKAEKKDKKNFNSGKTSAWGKYFMMYAAGGIPESIAYSESDSPVGPWKYVGDVMPQTNETKSFTNHSGIVEFKGHNYFFYHTGWLPGGGGFGRSVCVEEFKWNKDGRLPIIRPTYEGVAPIGTLNPYNRVEAETMAYSEGVKTEWNKKRGNVFVSDIQNGDWIKVSEVDFGTVSPKTFEMAAASALQGGIIEVRLDSPSGVLLTKLEVAPTGGWEEWNTFSSAVEPVSGKHDVYFLFKGLKGCKLFNLDWWKFNK
ncbi:MAG: family 43 glycosylhydrolase [Bacteroidaceae bacterium]|nr:family 43 glycosylhydrolase [Bacteroidaceae bacterium]